MGKILYQSSVGVENMPPNQPPGSNISGHSECPVLCITKVCLFIVTTLFVLYLPLGDPQIICDARNVPANQKGLICLCDLYNFVMDMADKTMEMIDQITCAAMHGLYEAKLKIYTAISTYDRQDYCRVGCSSKSEKEEDEDDNNIQTKKSSCKCRTKCCRKR